MRKAIVIVLLAALALGGVVLGNSLGSHPNDSWPGSNNVGNEPTVNYTPSSPHQQATLDALRWQSQPPSAACSLSSCDMYMWAQTERDALASYWFGAVFGLGTVPTANQICAMWRNSAMNDPCMFVFTFGSSYAIGQMMKHPGGIYFIWANKAPCCPFEGTYPP